MRVLIKKFNYEAKMPTRATDYAAGWDLYACLLGVHRMPILPGSRCVVTTGLCFEIPEGFEGQIRPRSGLAAKEGLVAAFGTIDSDYRGVIGVNLFNHSYQTVNIEHGQRIAQIVFQPVLKVLLEEVNELSETIRGDRGFGSSGK
jgi:dUTP pyrophosphatase